MADLCRECGIRFTEGLCQCPEVLLAEIERLRPLVAAADAARDSLLSMIRQLEGATRPGDSFDAEAVERVLGTAAWDDNLTVVKAETVRGWLHEITRRGGRIRSLRAKLMRERANTHDWVASMVDDGLITPTLLALEKSRQYHARARRLRAEAERVEGGRT